MGGIVVLERLRKRPIDVFHPLLGRWVRGQELQLLLVAFLFRHSFPEWYGLPWVVASPGHQDEPDVVRLALLQPAVLMQHLV